MSRPGSSTPNGRAASGLSKDREWEDDGSFHNRSSASRSIRGVRLSDGTRLEPVDLGLALLNGARPKSLSR